MRKSLRKVSERSGLAERAGVLIRSVKSSTIQHICTSATVLGSFSHLECLAKYDGRSEDSRVEALANGANDVVVVRKSTGQLVATGWYGQIGKLNSFFESRQGKEVTIFVERYGGDQGLQY